MGGGEKIYQPTPPAAPTSEQAIQAWIKGMPDIFRMQQEFAPQEAAQQVELAQQYARPLGVAYQQAQEAMYPGTTAVREQLTQQAQEGMAGDVPDWARQQYLSNVRAQLGEQAGSPIGADYLSTGMMQQQEDWRRHYQNLGLQLSGQQQQLQPQAPQATSYMGGFTPQGVGQQMQQGYSTYAQASRPMALQQPNYSGYLSGAGGFMSGLSRLQGGGGSGGGGGWGG